MSAARPRQSGMTLIEILVAISVLSVLSVMGYKAFSALLIARERLMQTSAQWIDLARVYRRVELDLDNLPQPGALGGGPRAAGIRLEGGASAQRLSLSVESALRFSGRDSLIYQSDSGGLWWSSQRAPGERFSLLAGDYQVHWRLQLEDGRWVEAWPDGSDGVPRLLEMRVAQIGIGVVTRLWSLP